MCLPVQTPPNFLVAPSADSSAGSLSTAPRLGSTPRHRRRPFFFYLRNTMKKKKKRNTIKQTIPEMFDDLGSWTAALVEAVTCFFAVLGAVPATGTVGAAAVTAVFERRVAI